MSRLQSRTDLKALILASRGCWPRARLRQGDVHRARHRRAGCGKPGRVLKAYFTNLMIPKDAGWWKDGLGPAGNALQHMKRLRVSSPGPSAR